MEKTGHIFAALIVAGGLGVMVTQGALAQPEQGCEDATPGETAVGAQPSEQVAEYVTPPGCDTGHITDETAFDCEALAEGSHAPMPGRGHCDEIDEMPRQGTEG